MAAAPAALRVIGTSVTLPEVLRRRAVEDLGFPIRFTILDGEACLQRGVLHPGSYDVYDQWFYSAELLWTAGAIEAIDTARIERWAEVEVPQEGQGTCPARVIHVQADGRLGPLPGPRIPMLPTANNADSFAFTPEVAAMMGAEAEESWGWFFDERLGGRNTVIHDPAIGAVELALAARAAGLVSFADAGDLSVDEIDALFDVLERRRSHGHFTRSWTTHEDSVRQMTGGACALGAIWSPAYYALRASGARLRYAVPREGYRSWQSGLCLSAAVTPAQRDLAYRYFNWWLSGVPGALLARQGYYMSVVAPVAERLSPEEFDFWYEGLPARAPLPGLDGRIVVPEGACREGGGRRARMSRTAVWATLMAEHNYLVKRWREFFG